VCGIRGRNEHSRRSLRNEIDYNNRSAILSMPLAIFHPEIS
jgi:hypothetical protein